MALLRIDQVLFIFECHLCSPFVVSLCSPFMVSLCSPFVVSLSNHEWTALRQAQGERKIDDKTKTKRSWMVDAELVQARLGQVK